MRAGQILPEQRVILIAALLVLSACSESDNHPEPGKLKTYSGIYQNAFEVSVFIPSSVAEHWWIREDPAFVSKLRDLPRVDLPGLPDARTAHLTVKGQVSALGPSGHLGAQQRELVVTQILEVSPANWKEFELAACGLPIPDWATTADRKTTLEACERDEHSLGPKSDEN